jgi:hypothetical protein
MVLKEVNRNCDYHSRLLKIFYAVKITVPTQLNFKLLLIRVGLHSTSRMSERALM